MSDYNPTAAEIAACVVPDDGMADSQYSPDSQLAADTCPQFPGNDEQVSTVDTPRESKTKREPFPVELLPRPMQDMVEAVSQSTNTDPSMAGLACLVIAAGCIGNRAVIELKQGYKEPSVLWGGIVARSGGGKSPVLKSITKPLHDRRKRQRADYETSETQYKADLARHEVNLTAWKHSSKGDVVCDPPLEPTAPTEERVIVADVTTEKMACLLNVNLMGLAAEYDELSGLLGGFDKYSNGKGSDRAVYLSLYDAASLTVDRKTSGSIYVERGAVSIIGGIQPGILRKSFGTMERDSGMLARFLLVQPPERPSLWNDKGIDVGISAAWDQLLGNLLDVKPASDGDGKPCPVVLTMDAGAKAMFVDWFDRFSLKVNHEGLDHLQSHYSKLRAVCARLALILALTEAATSGTSATTVSVPAMAVAMALTDWFAGEAARVYAMLGASEEQDAEQELLSLIRRHGGSISPRELQRASRLYPNADDAEAALRNLWEHGHGSFAVQSSKPTGGHQPLVFQLSTVSTVDACPKTHGKTRQVSTGRAE